MSVELAREGSSVRVLVSGALDRSVRDRVAPLVESAIDGGARDVRIDLGGLERFDSLALTDLLAAVAAGRRRGVGVKLERAPRSLRETLSLVSVDRLLQEPPAETGPGFLARLGGAALPVFRAARAHLRILVETFWFAVAGPFKGRGPRFDRCVREVALAGVNAVPIVVVISLLLGVILAMQAAAQLRQFGATIYVANLVGVSLTREIGPLVTSILVAGRSGSALAAEIGTMVVSEEIDALRQMGLHPVRFLVVPKVLALAVAIPCLAVLADAIGILGGTVVAYSSLDIPPAAYLEQTRKALFASDLATGLVKCVVFGGIVGTVGCAQGLAVRGGGEGVGRATTAAVVVSIFGIILADAFFTTLFHGI